MTDTNTLTAQVFNSLVDVPKAQWNGLLQQASCTFAYEFWQVVEESQLNDFDYRYLLLFDTQGEAVALTSFYAVTTDIAIFAPQKLREVLTKIRRVWPNFLKLRMLECGTPIILNSPPFVAKANIPHESVISALHQVLLDTAQREKQLLIVIRDFEPNAAALKPTFEGFGYHWVDSLPNTYLDINWTTPEDYLASMKSYYRSKLLKHLRRNEVRQIHHRVVDEFDDLAEVLCAQWQVVHEQADEFQREVLTPRFYREFSKTLGQHSKAILFYQQQELVGHALLLLDGGLLRWLYVGRKQAANDSLYLYVCHKVIETAILLGAKRLELGLTTYSIKQDMGAQVVPINMAVRGVSSIINPWVGLVYPLMNHTPNISNKWIFKK